jgi:membrane protein DedA with SNARE-associated domain
MKLRMYVMLPDLASARRLANDLLLARVDDKCMHFLGKRGTYLGELREAGYLQKSDIVHGAFLGLVVGGVMGVVVGTMLVNFPPSGRAVEFVAVLIAALVGSVLGTWVASMIGLQFPNSRLARFESDLEDGKILLMLDVPSSRYEEVRSVIARTHPEAIDRGNEPTVPAFP